MYRFRFYEIRKMPDEWRRSYLLGNLVSELWVSWGNFCKKLYIESCRGAKFLDGSVSSKILGDLSDERLCYLARQAKNGETPKTNGHLKFKLHNEPTWADIDVFIKIINVVGPSNKANILLAFGAFHDLKKMQIVRNFYAHKGKACINSLNTLSNVYDFSNIKSENCIPLGGYINPTKKGVTIFENWVFEMEQIAKQATKQA